MLDRGRASIEDESPSLRLTDGDREKLNDLLDKASMPRAEPETPQRAHERRRQAALESWRYEVNKQTAQISMNQKRLKDMTDVPVDRRVSEAYMDLGFQSSRELAQQIVDANQQALEDGIFFFENRRIFFRDLAERLEALPHMSPSAFLEEEYAEVQRAIQEKQSVLQRGGGNRPFKDVQLELDMAENRARLLLDLKQQWVKPA